MDRHSRCACGLHNCTVGHAAGTGNKKSIARLDKPHHHDCLIPEAHHVEALVPQIGLFALPLGRD